MPIELESPEAREFRHFTHNPDVISEQPRIRLSQNPIISQLDVYTPTGIDTAYATVAQFRVTVSHGIRSATIEQRQATVVANSKEDILSLVRDRKSTRLNS